MKCIISNFGKESQKCPTFSDNSSVNSSFYYTPTPFFFTRDDGYCLVNCKYVSEEIDYFLNVVWTYKKYKLLIS